MAEVSGPTRLAQVSIAVDDLERATAFYRDVLGFPHAFMSGGMSFFELDGLRLLLGPRGGEHAHGTSILYYRVSDIENEHRRLQAANVRVLEAPREIYRQRGHALWLGFYADSEENAFALMEEKAGG